MALVHIVMWTLKEQAAGAGRASNAARMKALLESMRGKVDGLLRLEVGLASAGLEANRDVVLLSEFTDAAALAAYQNHPGHLAMKPWIGEIRATRHVLDFHAPAGATRGPST
jgi:quinol monooxygenase YgiN